MGRVVVFSSKERSQAHDHQEPRPRWNHAQTFPAIISGLPGFRQPLTEADELRVYVLQDDGNYAERQSSPAFPFLPLDEVKRFLDRAATTDETSWIRSFRSWVGSLVKKPG